jgi:RNA polymerase sigma factor (sigma-70 family)
MATVVQPVGMPFRNRLPRSTVTGVAGLATTTLGADEAVLAQRAAGGDGEAFADLYERYEERVLNLCFRILGSQDDAADATQDAFVNVLRRLPKLEGRELAFGSYVFTSARNACYDLIERRRRTEPSDEIPEHATPMGGAVGGGGVGFDPGDPEDDPERNVLLDARTEEIRRANLTLPERQREALALKELDDLSYDEVAEIMGMNRNSVAQLISRARINLRGALRGEALAAIIPNAPQCERAVPLIGAEEDGELDPDSTDAEWLTDHLVMCETCRLRREAMAEAGISYRAWLPISAGPFLFRETMAEAAELVGADWSGVVARRESARSVTHAAAAGSAASGAGTEGARAAVLRHRRLDLALMAVLGLALVLVVFVGPTSDDAPITAIVPAADEQQAPPSGQDEGQAPKPAKAAKKNKKQSGGDKGPGAAAPGQPADTAEEAGQQPASDGGETPAGAGASGGRQRGSSGDGQADRSGGGNDRGGVAGDPETEQPPADTTTDPPPPPPPPDTTPTDPGGCRSASGAPIPCPPAQPPTRTPPPRITLPPRTPPPRTPPPRVP